MDGRGDGREENVRMQVLNHRKRCDWMRWAATLGFASALLLLLMLLCGLADAVFDVEWIKWVAAGSGAVGIVGVMAAATLALAENASLREVMDDELQQVPDLLERQRRDERQAPAVRSA
jgi:uncharacterized iron-regulated membrane protein